jgi:hypothetical protein
MIARLSRFYFENEALIRTSGISSLCMAAFCLLANLFPSINQPLICIACVFWFWVWCPFLVFFFVVRCSDFHLLSETDSVITKIVTVVVFVLFLPLLLGVFMTAAQVVVLIMTALFLLGPFLTTKRESMP